MSALEPWAVFFLLERDLASYSELARLHPHLSTEHFHGILLDTYDVAHRGDAEELRFPSVQLRFEHLQTRNDAGVFTVVAVRNRENRRESRERGVVAHVPGDEIQVVLHLLLVDVLPHHLLSEFRAVRDDPVAKSGGA